MDPLSFTVRARDGAARAGLLRTPHGTLDTPAFFPVGTYGAVRGISPAELRTVGVQGVLANTYHLHLRPGEELVRALGGLHGFMGWDGPILTDSGGFQLYSLEHLSQRSEEGVRFRSPIDGSPRFLSPESCVEIQEALGGDLICALDEFWAITPAGAKDASRARDAVERTLRWAERCLRARRRRDVALFGIVQGGGDAELRAESAARTAALGFDGHAIGGLGVGESAEQRCALLVAALAPLPSEAPRYLMGLGEPPDLVDGIGRGVDLFDCVVPTRHGRHGVAFTHNGRLQLRNARFREDSGPLDPDCACPACRGHSRAYLRHLLASGEALGARLLSLHNIAYYMRLLGEARDSIADQTFKEWSKGWRERYASGDQSGEAADSAA